MGKRRHGVDKFPEIEEKIRSGEYIVREAKGRNKNTCQITWSHIRYIYDEQDNEIKDYFFCAKCHAIFNLVLRNSGQVLKRHVEEKCPGDVAENDIGNYFAPEFQLRKKRKLKQADKTQVRDASIGYVVRDMRPISSMNGQGMATLLSTMTMIGAKYGHLSEAAIEQMKLVPSRQTTTRLIVNRAAVIRDQIKEVIQDVFRKYGGAVSLDEWTDKCRKISFFGLTLHYISEVDGQLKTNDRVLLIRELSAEKKNGAYLKDKIMEYMLEFKLMPFIENKIVFVSDRGPSIVSACRSFQSIHCFAHLIHNVVEKMLEKNPIVSAVSAIVKYFKASGLNAIFDQTLKSYVSTRWSSVYRMLESVIERWDKIVEQLLSRGAHQVELDSISLDALKMLRDFLKPFAVATSEVEATKRTTIDIVRPWYTKLMSHLQTKCTDSEMITKLKTVGHEYWIKNVQLNITMWHDVAVFLNPMMKNLKPFNDIEKNRIWTRTAELMDDFMPVVNLTNYDSDQSNSRNRNSNVSDALSAFMDDSDNESNGTNERSEIEKYKSKRVSGLETTLQWWQKNKDIFPRLYGVARFIFAIPASSASPERLFSSAGRLVHFRPNMRAEMVDEILFLKSNYDLIEKLDCVRNVVENENELLDAGDDVYLVDCDSEYLVDCDSD